MFYIFLHFLTITFDKNHMDRESKYTCKTQYQRKYQASQRTLEHQNQTIQHQKYQRKMYQQKSGDPTRKSEQIPLLPVSRIHLMVYQQHTVNQINPGQDLKHENANSLPGQKPRRPVPLSTNRLLRSQPSGLYSLSWLFHPGGFCVYTN